MEALSGKKTYILGLLLIGWVIYMKAKNIPIDQETMAWLAAGLGGMGLTIRDGINTTAKK
jgi:hypothetical protein